MKLRSAFLLIVLVAGSAAFLYFLWNEGRLNNVSCKEKQENTPKNGAGGDFPANPLPG